MAEGQTRVLLVEDNAADARLMRELLAEVPRQPFVVTVAGTLRDAILGLGDHDIVLLDLSLPDAHGVGTISRVVDVRNAPPVVVLTGNTDDEVALKAVSLGADDYLLKSEITPSLIARTILYAIERRRGIAQAQQMLALEIARAESVRSAERARFLGDLSAGFATTLAFDEVVHLATRQLVPALADYCSLDVRAANDAFERVGAHAVDESIGAAVRTLSSLSLSLEHSEIRVAAEQRRVVEISDISCGGDADVVPSLRTLGVRPALLLPLLVRGRVLGVLTLVLERDGLLDDERRALAEEASRRTALALDNALLYRATQRALGARDEMLAIVSHDLRNPLSIMTLALRSLQRALDTGALPRRELIGRGMRAIVRMERLINDLLDVACMDAGEFVVSLAPLDVNSVLREAVDQNSALALEKKIELACDLEGAAYAQGDRDRLMQVVINLLGNAIKFTPSGGAIMVRCTQGPTSLIVSVEDSGPGIREDIIPHIFDRYYRSGAKRGVGLGLTIAKGIVEAHHGTIGVESEPERGARFWFELPLSSPHREEVA
ncbi:MAG: sensor signal transduction histidine kinase [Myxococcaceae bacterium]|nr:sensor signal transduction histidine kinase [Myxococcaceae bacterium]